MLRFPRRSLALAAATAVLLVGAACGDDDDDSAADEFAGGTSSSTAAAATDSTATTTAATTDASVLAAVLTGAEEVPGPGLADATGGAELTFEAGKVCYVLNVAMGEKPTMAHIHKGAKGASGDVVVNLAPTFELGEATHDANGCADADQAVLDSILAAPDGFYVNVHTAEHPAGAVRGQLGPKA
jgi:hypothetical protein